MTGKLKYILLASLIFAACGRGNQATIKGTFSGVNDKTVYVDLITINDIALVDTVVTDDKGRFKLRVSLPDAQPAFYNVRCNDQTITLLLSPGETVELRSLCNLARNYLVEGSEGSQQIRELNEIMYSSRGVLDSLSDLYILMRPEDPARRSVLSQYSRMFVQQKRDMIKFIVNHPTSLSAVYALYQRMPNGDGIFNDAQDVVYYKMVADSLSSRFPGSPHVKSLLRDVELMNNRMQLNQMLSEAEVSDVEFPDIELPDMFGKRIKLSSLKGKVVLLDFWTAAAAENRLVNAELAEVYGEYAGDGFEIYQVSLDDSKSLWVTAVQEQKLPWISVCDFNGANSPAVRLYNITSLPANFLIDRNGRIVARNVPPERLAEQVRKLL